MASKYDNVRDYIGLVHLERESWVICLAREHKPAVGFHHDSLLGGLDKDQKVDYIGECEREVAAQSHFDECELGSLCYIVDLLHKHVCSIFSLYKK